MRESSWEHQRKRKLDYTKAARKRKVCRYIYETEWYDNLHQYSKNKIHCSCQMCRFRSDWEPGRKTVSDIRKQTGMDCKEKEYIEII